MFVIGENFVNSSNLQCRFVQAGAMPTYNFVTSPVIFVNTSSIKCLVPSKAAFSTASSVDLYVANFADSVCDEFVLALSGFTYDPPCLGVGCAGCPIGRYISGRGCVLCPAGRYGSQVNLTTNSCSGPCAQGHYCPEGSTTPANSSFQCPPGTYGATTGLDSSACSGLCHSGYYCPEGTIYPSNLCPRGRYGGEGEHNSQCRGPCQAGYYCKAGAIVRTEFECGSVEKYCPEGSGEPLLALPGFYTTGNTTNTRESQAECEVGHYCAGGVKHPCPAGRYQSMNGSSSPTCEGPCQAGFFCPEAAASPTAENCAPDNSTAPARFFCPQGTSLRQLVRSGYFTGPETAPQRNREFEAPCLATDFCANGTRIPPSPTPSSSASPTGSPTATASTTVTSSSLVNSISVSPTPSLSVLRVDLSASPAYHSTSSTASPTLTPATASTSLPSISPSPLLSATQCFSSSTGIFFFFF